MFEVDTVMMKVSSLVFLCGSETPKENEDDYILIGGHGDDSDETVPDEFDE